MRTPIEEGGVVFLNFPASEHDGELGYDGGMLHVARMITEKIPKWLRDTKAVIIDFSQIPAWDLREKLIEQSLGYTPPEEQSLPSESEQFLLELLR